MYDMATDKYVSVDDLIESGEYTADYCENRLDRIVKTHPSTLNPTLFGQLNKLLDKWATEEENYRRKKGDSTRYSHSSEDIIKNTKYGYTYLLNSEPMHVFITCIDIIHLEELDYTTIEIRVDNKGNIVGDYTDGIIQNSCDIKTKCPDL